MAEPREGLARDIPLQAWSVPSASSSVFDTLRTLSIRREPLWRDRKTCTWLSVREDVLVLSLGIVKLYFGAGGQVEGARNLPNV